MQVWLTHLIALSAAVYLLRLVFRRHDRSVQAGSCATGGSCGGCRGVMGVAPGAAQGAGGIKLQVLGTSSSSCQPPAGS